MSRARALAMVSTALLATERATAEPRIGALLEPLRRRGAAWPELWPHLCGDPAAWAVARQRLGLVAQAVAQQPPLALAVGGLAMLLAAVVGAWLARRLRGAAVDGQSVALSHQGRLALLTSLARHAPALVPVATLTALGGLAAGPNEALQPLVLTCQAALLFLVLRVALRAVLAPYPPAPAFTPLGADTERRLARATAGLVLVATVGVLLATIGPGLGWPGEARLLARGGLVLAAVIMLAWLLAQLDQWPSTTTMVRRWRPAAVSCLIVAGWAEILGLRELSSCLLSGVVGTLLLRPALWLLSRLLVEFLDGLDTDGLRWLDPVRTNLGLEPGAPWPGAGWLRFVAGCGMSWLAVLALARAWTAPGAWPATAALLFGDWALGGLRLSLARGVAALAALGLLLALNAVVAAALDHRLRRLPRFDVGARTAAVNSATYAGFALAGLVALTCAGLDTGRLTVVFGALSVGIGFGLQNIVNNFVSGLILLFERPVRVGDWIRLGELEGEVQRLTVRSTEILTADRDEIILPNSELITKMVINLTRHDSRGRVVLPVKVAPGTHPERLRRVLLDLALDHPQVARGADGPVVLLRAVSGKSLDFELRCVVDHVTHRAQVASDLNQALLRALNARGIALLAN